MPAPSLAEQIEEVAKTVRDRQRSWLDEGRRGRMLEATALLKTERLAAAERSLRWLAANMGWIKAYAEARRLHDVERSQAAPLAPAPAPSQIDDVRSDPLVQDMLRHFPDAEILGVRDLPPPDLPTPDAADAPPDPDATPATEEAA